MNIKKIEKLIKLLEESDLSEIEVKTLFNNVILRKTPRSGSRTERASAEVVSESTTEKETIEIPSETTEGEGEPEPTPTETARNLQQVTAPMVGTFYRAPSPTSEPYVKEGDTVSKGEVLCIIEAMKLMNEIESEYSGKIVEIHIENAQPVEYGTVLFTIEV